jgi:outer membrane protein OmpA-like peptidoglycan-associated protein
MECCKTTVRESADNKWLIIGHADVVGMAERNKRLSEHRSKAVKDYLVSRFQMKPESLTVWFLGQNRPRATNDTVEGRTENRRVEIVFDE